MLLKKIKIMSEQSFEDFWTKASNVLKNIEIKQWLL
jgi:hypothetical protein